MKKIAIVTNSVWNAYNFRKEFIVGLAQDGYQVHIIAHIDNNENNYFHKMNGVFLHDVYTDTRSKNIIKDIKYILYLWIKFKDIKPDIVFNFVMKPLIYSSIVANFQKVPVVNTQTGLGTAFINGGIVSWLTLLLYRVAYKNKSRKVFFHNGYDMNLFIENKIVSKEQSDTIPGSGIDLNKFQIKRKERQTGELTFLLVARIIKDKGIGEFLDSIESFNKLHNRTKVKFEIMGSFVEDGGVNSQLKERILKLDAENVISYRAFIKDITSQMIYTDVVVLPSYREGTSRVLLEASALKIPIITTDVPGCNNVVVDNVTGLLCKSKSSSDLLQKIIKMSNLSDFERESMGAKGREYVANNFSVDLVVKKYRLIIYDILKIK